LLLAKWEGPVHTDSPYHSASHALLLGYHRPLSHQVMGESVDVRPMDFGFIM